ncbi:hypothetical protein KQ304_06975 [Synechococcus sp. CS-1329]|uniref:hypothetical protein n=1 Tax=Synechococcus sp. CS-1329 TaxID=2847975 RepID=UPI00223B4347|nr:hypothetical protein [Synechococcus sp. CS-1329]MCT0218740.1 hypothetical protein [Synechococcus sp. CS-1329]
MAADDKIIESIKFLLKSVKQLSDRFLETDAKLTRSFDGVMADLNDLHERLARFEPAWSDGISQPQVSSPRPAASDLPVTTDSAQRVIPSLNLSLVAILDAYASTPILLEPFSRSCGVSGRTLTGEIGEVELEVVEQGTTWALETLDDGWLLLPRPGSLERRTQLQSLERLFDITGVKELPVVLHMIRPAEAEAVVFGRRWQLKAKGELSVHPDPIRASMTQKMAELEQRLSQLEARG